MKKSLLVLVVIAALFIGGVLFIKSQNIGAGLLWNLSNGGKWIFPLVTAGALIDSVQLCAFSIMILTVAFLLSMGRLRSDILMLGSFYIFGTFTVYILIGLGILHTLYLFNTPNFMAKLGGGLLIILGAINILNVIFPNFPIRLKIPKATHHAIAGLIEKASATSAYLLGALVGLCAFPCAGGPYLMILGLLHDKVTYLKGLGYLVYYNLVFILPLVIILFISANKKVLEKVEIWQKQENKTIKWVSGLAMIILGYIIFLI